MEQPVLPKNVSNRSFNINEQPHKYANNRKDVNPGICRLTVFENLQLDADVELLIDAVLSTVSYEANGECHDKLVANAFEGLKATLYFQYVKSRITQSKLEPEQWKHIQESLNAITSFMAKRYASFSIFSIPPFIGPIVQEHTDNVAGSANPLTRLISISEKNISNLEPHAQVFDQILAILVHEITHAVGHASITSYPNSLDLYKPASTGWIHYDYNSQGEEELTFTLLEELTAVANENAFLRSKGWKEFQVFTNQILDAKAFPNAACFQEFYHIARTLYKGNLDRLISLSNFSHLPSLMPVFKDEIEYFVLPHYKTIMITRDGINFHEGGYSAKHSSFFELIDELYPEVCSTERRTRLEQDLLAAQTTGDIETFCNRLVRTFGKRGMLFIARNKATSDHSPILDHRSISLPHTIALQMFARANAS